MCIFPMFESSFPCARYDISAISALFALALRYESVTSLLKGVDIVAASK
jgi:hypothetical protein